MKEHTHFCFMLNLVIAFKNMYYLKWFHTIPRFALGENAVGLLVLFFFFLLRVQEFNYVYIYIRLKYF